MGMFDGMGGAYLGMGVAEGLQRLTEGDIRRRERERKNKREDKFDARWEEENTQSDADRVRRHQVEDDQLSRENTEYGWRVADRAHTMQLQPELDEHAKAMRDYDVKKIGWEGNDREYLEKTVRPREETMHNLGVQRERAAIANTGLNSRATQQRIDMGDMDLRDAREAHQRGQLIREFDGVMGRYRISRDPTEIQDWFRERVPDNQQIKVVRDPKTDAPKFDVYDHKTGALKGDRPFRDDDHMEDHMIRYLDRAEWERRQQVGVQRYNNQTRVDPKTNRVVEWNPRTGAWTPATYDDGSPVYGVPPGAYMGGNAYQDPTLNPGGAPAGAGNQSEADAALLEKILRGTSNNGI